jgi:hypothetical protein
LAIDTDEGHARCVTVAFATDVLHNNWSEHASGVFLAASIALYVALRNIEDAIAHAARQKGH